MERPMVALLTDLGTRDSYVAQMKGVVLGIAPNAQLVDVSHEIAPGDVTEAAWTLYAAWRSLPEGTVFICVVDPGVGSARRALALSADGRRAVGPDNGLFTLVLDDAVETAVVELTRRELWRAVVRATFHGRDIFAPVAARLALGLSLEDVGTPVSAPLERLVPVRPEPAAGGRIVGHVLHIDRFGNVITDVRESELPTAPFRVRIAGQEVTRLVRYYAEAGNDLVALVNSAGHLEVALALRSAAEELHVRRGDPVEIVVSADG